MEHFTTSEAAKLLGVTAKTLRAWDAEGTFEPCKVGPDGHRQYSEKQIEERTGKTICQLRNPFSYLNRENIDEMLAIAEQATFLDFHALLGQTIRQKYEAIYCELVKISYALYRKNETAPMNFILTSPEISAIFETCTAGFAPNWSTEIRGKPTIVYTGILNSRWRIYHSYMMQPNDAIMGYINEDNQIEYKENFLAVIRLTNFVSV
jgi:DNA-binding transcriptional MerR regulator